MKKENEIIEGNRLIAEFMGMKHDMNERYLIPSEGQSNKSNKE